MRMVFDNFIQQMVIINRFFERNTNLDKVCQYCGKPAEIKFSRENPYNIQLICRECKKEKNLNKSDMQGVLASDIPVINLFNHVKNTRTKCNIPILFEDEKEIINNILEKRMSKTMAIKEFNITFTQLNKIIDKYELYEDKDIKEKLNRIFNINKKNNIRQGILNHKSHYSSYNNLAKYKKERNLSNPEIAYLSRGEISISHISLICNDKVEPKIKTKCTLAEIFEVSVADLFPRDYLYSNIYCYMDYINLCTLVTYSFLDVYYDKKKNHEKHIVQNLTKEFHIKKDTIYKIISKKYLYSHSDLEIFLPILIDKYNKKF